MGAPHHPRRGSHAYSPRKRAKSQTPRINFWPARESPGMLGFAGYKAGMSHAVVIDNKKTSPTVGQEVAMPVTVLDCPPMVVVGYRAYARTPYGDKALDEVWSPKLPKDLSRRLKVGKGAREGRELAAEGASDVTAIVATQPRLSSVPKKKPELMEVGLGGSLEQKLAFARENLGKEVRARDLLAEGDHVDVVAITKGKGYQGTIKRWGIPLMAVKSEKARRKVGNLGPWTPSHTLSTVPQCGQMGYHKRTEVNKLVLKMGDKGEDVTPSGGFLGYGLVRGDYVVLKGSIPGPRKRLIRLRVAMDKGHVELPEMAHISTASQQKV